MCTVGCLKPVAGPHLEWPTEECILLWNRLLRATRVCVMLAYYDRIRMLVLCSYIHVLHRHSLKIKGQLNDVQTLQADSTCCTQVYLWQKVFPSEAAFPLHTAGRMNVTTVWSWLHVRACHAPYTVEWYPPPPHTPCIYMCLYSLVNLPICVGGIPRPDLATDVMWPRERLG